VKSEIGPDYCKSDWVVHYPYTQKGQVSNKPFANVAVVVWLGGKAGAYGIAGGIWKGKSAYIFQGDNDKAAVLAWDGTAKLDGTDKPIYVTGVSGKEISEYKCDVNAGCNWLIYLITIFQWQVSVALAAIGGWTTELIIVSWDSVGPTDVVYDPLFGMAGVGDLIINASSFLMPSIYSLLCSLIFYHLFSR